MQIMLIIVTILFIGGYFGFIRILFDMLQEDGALGIMGVTKLRAKLYRSRKAAPRMIENALGGCAKCTALWWGWFWALLYCGFVHFSGVEMWGNVFADILWVIFFVCACFAVGYKSLNNGVQ